MQNLESIKRAAFQRGFQKRAMVGSAIRLGRAVPAVVASAANPGVARMGMPAWTNAVAAQGSATAALRASSPAAAAARDAARQTAALMARSLPVNPWTTARNVTQRLPYTGGTPESIGRLAAAPWWKMGLGQGGGVRNVFAQGMSSPYIKYPALATLAGGAGLGINHMASGGMTPDGYKANWAMFSGGPPEMMPPMMPPQIQHQMNA